MGDKGKEATFEIPPEKAPEAAEDVLLEEGQLAKEGWTPQEITAAKAQGRVKAPAGEGGANGKGAGAGQDGQEGGEKGKKEGEDGAAAGKGADDKDKGAKDKKGDADKPWRLSDEDEKKLKETFGEKHPLTGVYFRMRTDQRKRQKAAAQLEEANVTVEQLRADNARLKSDLEKSQKAAGSAGGAKGKGGAEEEDPLDALLKGDGEGQDGKDKGGKDKPLTVADLERREAEKADAAKKRDEDTALRQKKLKVRLDTFIADAQERFEDYDPVSALAEEVLADLQAGQEGTLFEGDPETLELAQARAERFVRAVTGALDWKDGQKTPAEIFYELGKLHPKFRSGKSPKKKSGDDPEEAVPAEKNGRDAERIAQNAGRRSSAGVGGGGGPVVVSEKDLTQAQYLRLPREEKDRVSDATRKRLLAQS